ncbi:MAG: competence protein ComM, partial [Bdellovibrionales bacterium]|nr:competence protein ComM [Bdellovibrionales bacterium]
MKIFSFCEHLRQWIPVEIEVSLIPGLPQIHILGLPDSSLKESVLKIKSALKVQGFKLPKGQQVIVNIRGGDFKKKSLGLDLAIV